MLRASPATTAFVVYVLAGLLLGEVFPVSRFAMYSTLDTNPVAIPWFGANGEMAQFSDFGCFEGVDPEQVRPPSRQPYSSQYIWQAWRRGVIGAQRRGATGAPADVPVTFGYAMLRRDANGEPALDPPVTFTRGMACRR